MQLYKLKSTFLLVALLCFYGTLRSQQDSVKTSFTFLPEHQQFRELIANPQEARLGLWKFFTAEQMKVEIGGSLDVFSFKKNNSTFNVGIDFFGYANATGADGFHLQIDALDGFFGGNISLMNEDVQIRMRIIHNSAHLVDGNWNYTAISWRKPSGPIPTTKDFNELVCAKVISYSSLETRFYGGVSYATFILPSIMKRYSYLAGVEIHTHKIVSPLFGKETNLFLAYHGSLMGTPSYHGSNQIKCGIKFGEWETSGVIMYFAATTGRSFFSIYQSETLQTIGAGFSVQFP